MGRPAGHVAGAFGDFDGGILSLDVLLREHGEAIESDLIDRGLRLRQLGTSALTWRDLKVIVKHLGPDSALGRAMYPDGGWGLQEMLTAALVDTARWLVWAKTEDGRRGRNMPTPIPRPGVEGPEREGNTVMTVAEADKFLGYSMADRR